MRIFLAPQDLPYCMVVDRAAQQMEAGGLALYVMTTLGWLMLEQRTDSRIASKLFPTFLSWLMIFTATLPARHLPASSQRSDLPLCTVAS